MRSFLHEFSWSFYVIFCNFRTFLIFLFRCPKSLQAHSVTGTLLYVAPEVGDSRLLQSLKCLRDSLDTRTGAPFRAARNSASICRSSRASTAGHVIYGVCTLASAKFLCFQGLAGWSLGWGALKAKVVAL